MTRVGSWVGSKSPTSQPLCIPAPILGQVAPIVFGLLLWGLDIFGIVETTAGASRQRCSRCCKGWRWEAAYMLGDGRQSGDKKQANLSDLVHPIQAPIFCYPRRRVVKYTARDVKCVAKS